MKTGDLRTIYRGYPSRSRMTLGNHSWISNLPKQGIERTPATCLGADAAGRSGRGVGAGVRQLGAAPTGTHQRRRSARDPDVAGGRASARLPDGGATGKPKSENRHPSQIRIPKPEGGRFVALDDHTPVRCGLFVLRTSGFFRVSVFGLRISALAAADPEFQEQSALDGSA